MITFVDLPVYHRPMGPSGGQIRLSEIIIRQLPRPKLTKPTTPQVASTHRTSTLPTIHIQADLSYGFFGAASPRQTDPHITPSLPHPRSHACWHRSAPVHSGAQDGLLRDELLCVGRVVHARHGAPRGVSPALEGLVPLDRTRGAARTPTHPYPHTHA
jgi:hypothetical protein